MNSSAVPRPGGKKVLVRSIENFELAEPIRKADSQEPIADG